MHAAHVPLPMQRTHPTLHVRLASCATNPLASKIEGWGDSRRGGSTYAATNDRRRRLTDRYPGRALCSTYHTSPPPPPQARKSGVDNSPYSAYSAFPRSAAIQLPCTPAFTTHASGCPVSRASELGRIRVWTCTWAQAPGGRAIDTSAYRTSIWRDCA